MTKKHFIALADAIRGHNSIKYRIDGTFTVGQINALADFCQSQNQNFNRSRWLDYVAGRCGKNGGKL